MNVPLLIIDGVLVLIFLVGWAEATADSFYRLSAWRFLRAASLPIAIATFLHLATAMKWWLTVFLSLAHWIGPHPHWLVGVILSIASLVLFLGMIGIGFPLLVLRLTAFVISQFLEQPVSPEELAIEP